MSRSLKKPPFVEAKLYNRVLAMNEKGEKKVLKTWSRGKGSNLSVLHHHADSLPLSHQRSPAPPSPF